MAEERTTLSLLNGWFKRQYGARHSEAQMNALQIRRHRAEACRARSVPRPPPEADDGED